MRNRRCERLHCERLQVNGEACERLQTQGNVSKTLPAARALELEQDLPAELRRKPVDYRNLVYYVS
jgi:hypothetical protein